MALSPVAQPCHGRATALTDELLLTNNLARSLCIAARGLVLIENGEGARVKGAAYLAEGRERHVE